jgi:catalase (peroxidase I)|tara:strand:- start:655 stop:990 length:336 start_codon:yes stop_codon:yes gene_type:complete
MRVKLSYTVKTEDVLKEAAKILNLSADDMSQAIGLFNSVQEELRADKSDDGVVNVKRVKEMMEEFRGSLLSIDTRLMEVSEIVVGYDEYQNALASGAATIASSSSPVDGDE